MNIRNRVRQLYSFAASLVFLSSSLATAAPANVTTGNVDIGALLGVAINSQSTYLNYGLQGTYRVMAPIRAGLEVTNYSTTAGNITSRLTTFTVKGLYEFTDQYLQGATAGVQVGLGMLNTSVTGIPQDSTDNKLILGPTIGYDYAIVPNVSLGGQANALFNTPTGLSSVWQIFFAAKYWI